MDDHAARMRSRRAQVKALRLEFQRAFRESGMSNDAIREATGSPYYWLVHEDGDDISPQVPTLCKLAHAMGYELTLKKRNPDNG